MHVLAVDTTLGACSVALSEMGIIKGFKEENTRSKQAELLVPMIQDLLADCNTAYSQLDLLACTCGPGSFTGVRIGMTVIKGLACVLQCPVVGVSSLASIVQDVADIKQTKIAVINAQRGQVYVQRFSIENRPLSLPDVIDIAQLSSYMEPDDVVVGNVQELEVWQAGQQIIEALPHAKQAVKIAEQQFKNVGADDILVPLYIRPPDAVIPAC